MDMISFTIKLYELGLEVFTDLGKYGLHIVQHFLAEYGLPAFGYKDQMDMHVEYAMSTVPNIA